MHVYLGFEWCPNPLYVIPVVGTDLLLQKTKIKKLQPFT